MDCRDHKGILKNPADEISIYPPGYSQAKRASFNDNGVLKKILIERLNESGSCSQDDSSLCLGAAKDSAPVIEELEETVISVPIEDVEEKPNDPEEMERRKMFEEKRKHHERVNIKELLKNTDVELEKD